MHEELFKNIPAFFKEPHMSTLKKDTPDNIIQKLEEEFESVHSTGKTFFVKLRLVLEKMPTSYIYFGNTQNIAQSLRFWLFRNPTLHVKALRLDIFEHIPFGIPDKEEQYLDSWVVTFE